MPLATLTVLACCHAADLWQCAPQAPHKQLHVPCLSVLPACVT